MDYFRDGPDVTIPAHAALIAGYATSAPASASKTYRDSEGIGTDLTTYTFSSMTVGSSDTQVVVGILAFGSVYRKLSSVTVTGNNSGAHTATLDHNDSGLGGNTFAGFARATISGDTSVTVSVTFSGACVRAAIFLWSVQNMATSVSDSNEGSADTTSPYTASVTTPAGGLGFAVVADTNTTSPTISWSTYTENGEVTTETRTMGGASITGSDSSGPTATYSASSGGRLAAVTYDNA